MAHRLRRGDDLGADLRAMKHAQRRQDRARRRPTVRVGEWTLEQDNATGGIVARHGGTGEVHTLVLPSTYDPTDEED